MTPECSLYLHGFNKTPTVKLNTQYRMVPDIEDLANKISQQNVYARIMPHNRVKMTNTARDEGAQTIFDTGISGGIGFDEVIPYIL